MYACMLYINGVFNKYICKCYRLFTSFFGFFINDNSTWFERFFQNLVTFSNVKNNSLLQYLALVINFGT